LEIDVKFLITMNMPARSGPLIHQIICEHPAQSLNEFCRALETTDFLVVDEFYRDTDAPRGADAYYHVGQTAINHRYVGKVKMMGNVTHQHRGVRDHD